MSVFKTNLWKFQVSLCRSREQRKNTFTPTLLVFIQTWDFCIRMTEFHPVYNFTTFTLTIAPEIKKKICQGMFDTIIHSVLGYRTMHWWIFYRTSRCVVPRKPHLLNDFIFNIHIFEWVILFEWEDLFEDEEKMSYCILGSNKTQPYKIIIYSWIKIEGVHVGMSRGNFRISQNCRFRWQIDTMLYY